MRDGTANCAKGARRSLEEHLFAPGPKRILALDGGGLLGVISLQFLARLEALIQARLGPQARLCDYFDLIGGTSTGSIIAAGLATGRSVQDLISLYLTLGQRIFTKSFWSTGMFGARYSSGPLVEALTAELGDIRLGGREVETGLAIVCKRVDSNAPWVLHNNPRGKFYGDDETKAGGLPNRDLPLVRLIRASTAAPTFFAPEFIEISDRETAAFVDGAVSPYNNPALLLTMMASQEGYRFDWPMGREKLLVVSVGTGRVRGRTPLDRLRRFPSALLAVHSLKSLIADTGVHSEQVLQWMGACPAPWRINSEVEFAAGSLPEEAKLLTYLRFDVRFDADYLRGTLDLDLPIERAAALERLDAAEAMDDMIEIGRRAAALQVEDRLLPEVFDPRSAGQAAQ